VERKAEGAKAVACCQLLLQASTASKNKVANDRAIVNLNVDLYCSLVKVENNDGSCFRRK
jgi:hypothetical protein